MQKVLKFIGTAAICLVLGSSPALASGSGGHNSKDTGEKTTKSEQGAHPNFVVFPDLTATVLDGYKVKGLMNMGYGLEIPDPALRKKARQLLPRLQDTFATEFSRYAGSMYHAGEIPDAEYLHKRMQNAADRMLGQGKSTFLISYLMVR